MGMNQVWVAGIVFLLTYAVIISEKLHRTVVALLGAAVLLIMGTLSQETALHHIDFNTLGLLTGMMIIVGITRHSGVFQYLAIVAARWAKGEPMAIMVALATITAVLSAFLDNVTTVLLIVPVTFSITRELKINPIPFLISQVLASNIGGTATLIGDPPNIMIGSQVKELTFNAFIWNLTPVIIIIFIVTIYLLKWIYRKDLNVAPELKSRLMAFDPYKEIKDPLLLKKSLLVLALTIAGFATHQIFHLESATIAMAGATLLMLISKVDMEKIFHEVEWPTLFFFIGLFILVGGLVEVGIIKAMAEKSLEITEGNLTFAAMLILWVSAIASAFVDNIPFVATMIPLIKTMGQLGNMGNIEPLWWALSLGACLGGNGTIIGASANVIVAGMAERQGYPMTFVGFMRIAFPLMIVSIIISSAYIYLRYLL
ncbi:SLC13 family permease [Carboxydocella sp. ULO1]|uniref:SLC13 family permease n=1 Tax=Carboxydocella sp. ULO1 TaxID=1926599 RepID=UPI0009AC629C|nr:ArsB/NhaD family transporter [Carboxydocella sp. ULO1]